MAINYDTLVASKDTQGSILNRINYARLDPEQILDEAEGMLYTHLRTREMRKEATFTIPAGVDFYPVPDRFMDPISLYSSDQLYNVTLIPEFELHRIRVFTNGVLEQGTPFSYALFGPDDSDAMHINFDFKTSEEERYRYLFFQQPAPLSSSNQTNFITSRYPQLMWAAIEAMAFNIRHDDANYERSMQRFFQHVERINLADDYSRRGEYQDFGLNKVGPSIYR